MFSVLIHIKIQKKNIETIKKTRNYIKIYIILFTCVVASDIEQLSRFASGGYSDDSTIVYLQHPCVILTALEVLGYKVVASSSTSVKQDYNEYMWTMRKDFSEPEPEPVIKTGMILQQLLLFLLIITWLDTFTYLIKNWIYYIIYIYVCIFNILKLERNMNLQNIFILI